MITKHISFGTGSFTKSYRLNDFIPFFKHVFTQICWEPIGLASSSRIGTVVSVIEKMKT